MFREELRQDLGIRRREEDLLHPRVWTPVEASDTAAQVLIKGQLGHQGQVREVTAVNAACRPWRPIDNWPMTRKTTPTAASTAIAAYQSRPHRRHSTGGTTPAAQLVEGRYPAFATCQPSIPWVSPSALPRKRTTLRPKPSRQLDRRQLHQEEKGFLTACIYGETCGKKE